MVIGRRMTFDIAAVAARIFVLCHRGMHNSMNQTTQVRAAMPGISLRPDDNAQVSRTGDIRV